MKYQKKMYFFSNTFMMEVGWMGRRKQLRFIQSALRQNDVSVYL